MISKIRRIVLLVATSAGIIAATTATADGKGPVQSGRWL
jgi:hypothetical protein